MQPIATNLTKLLDITTPIVSAPMANASTSDMAAAVSAAGAFGFLAAGSLSSAELKQNLQSVRNILKLPRTTRTTTATTTTTTTDEPVPVPIPVGVGFLGWILENSESDDVSQNNLADDPSHPKLNSRLAAVLDECPKAVWFAFGSDLGKYIAQVRLHNANRAQAHGHAHKTVVFVVVNSVQEALRATNEWKVDVLVVQGTEAGGHASSSALPLLPLLTEILTLIPTSSPTPTSSPPILAAGGISTGSQIAALLTLGAHGVVVGTRFLSTPECAYTPAMKRAILSAASDVGLTGTSKMGTGANTARSTAFDEVTPGSKWPVPEYSGRALVSSHCGEEDEDGGVLWDEVISEGGGVEARRRRYEEGCRRARERARARGGMGDDDEGGKRRVIWAGSGVSIAAGLAYLNESGDQQVKSASDVIHELHANMITTLKSASMLIQKN